ncbi:hypothetical protein Fmac_015914 [Flemingia macrophylla]|uniref:Ycf15 n=1 Tax=Flemingia macrophylla TaxID=520843 RepID=A0ABD1MFZ0_9FABA
MLRRMEFSQKWIMWIMACLQSARAFVLVNGSPTNEFCLHKELRRDPLAPF